MKTEFHVKLNANSESYAITDSKVWLGRRVLKLLVKLKAVLSAISELIMRIFKAQEEYEKLPELEAATPISKRTRFLKKYFSNENLIYQMTSTRLAEILSQAALDKESYQQQKSDLNEFLENVYYQACEGNRDAERALKSSNSAQDTPLCLLVKMGNVEGARCILPLYEAEDLFSQTLWGNTVLHLAAVSGQKEMALAIMKRADELGVLDQLLLVKNESAFTADELYQKLMHAANKAVLKNIDNEMAQALIGETRVSVAKRGFSDAEGDLKSIFQRDWYRYIHRD